MGSESKSIINAAELHSGKFLILTNKNLMEEGAAAVVSY